MHIDSEHREIAKVPAFRELHQVPVDDVRELINSSLAPAEALRLLSTLEFLKQVDQTKVVVAFHGPEAVAIGFVAPSMHSFDHWGVNLAAVRPGFRTWEGLDGLVENLTDHVTKCVDVLEHKPDSLMIAGGTRHPEVFARQGFHTVHEHDGPDGKSVAWVMKVAPSDGVTFHRLAFSAPTISPRQWDFVRPLTNAQQLGEAAEIISATWGQTLAAEFLQEVAQLTNYPGSQVYGIIDDGRVRGVGVIIKALHHPEAWSRAWIAIDPSLRGGGYGTKLIQGLLHHAESLHPFLSDGPMVMEGNTNSTTVEAGYYLRFGSMPAAERETPVGRSVWTMRITAAPAGQASE